MGLLRTTTPAQRKRKRARAKAKQVPWKLAAPVLAARKRSVRRPAAGRPSWKLLGLAGLAGVAATGVVVARRRAHSDLEPDELRERLHNRLGEVGATHAPAPRDVPR